MQKQHLLRTVPRKTTILLCLIWNERFWSPNLKIPTHLNFFRSSFCRRSFRILYRIIEIFYGRWTAIVKIHILRRIYGLFFRWHGGFLVRLSSSIPSFRFLLFFWIRKRRLLQTLIRQQLKLFPFAGMSLQNSKRKFNKN